MGHSNPALRYPALAGPVFDALTVEGFTRPEYAAVRARPSAPRRAVHRLALAVRSGWMVRQQTTSTVTSALISELGVEAIQVDDDAALYRQRAGPSAGGLVGAADRE